MLGAQLSNKQPESLVDLHRRKFAERTDISQSFTTLSRHFANTMKCYIRENVHQAGSILFETNFIITQLATFDHFYDSTASEQ